MIKNIFVYSCAATFLISCSNNTSDKPSVTETPKDTVTQGSATQPENALADFKFHTLVINVPSPFEIVTLLPKAGIQYKEGLVNSTDNMTKYTTTTKKGLNYGVYIVDLQYLSSNEHFLDVKNYFKAAGTLAKSLGFAGSFDKIVGPRVEKNIDKKDTINMIVDQVYTEMDNYLRSNDRLLTATQILVSSWIESQFITVSLIKDEAQNSNNDILFQKVISQSFTSQKLVELLKDFEKEKDFKSTIEGIRELDKIYSNLKGNQIDKETLQKLYAQLNVVRGKIVN